MEERLRQKGIVSKFSLGDNFSGSEIPREVVLMLKVSGMTSVIKVCVSNTFSI